ncbi:hypothetical protein OEZ85_003533 [Tetradesmus obliquus]|uniref:Enhancer of polycomb-like protein n=1 Tax=Tetradesmus obliquus TaxID=3088 RepID=A0ABY8UC28_TETOB|nr:hypothetical protein OEZ85_003533 [Tetradesmus obliquus]
MSTRAAIRPRPLDNNKPLLIVKDVSELDPDAQPLGADNGGHGSHGHGHGAGGKNDKKAIPIPDITEVETHYRDYLPLFSPALTYLHGKGCGGNKEPEPVEYDLDNEDEDWLATYNLGRTRLNDVLFERMLWKLELECAAATEHALTAAGAGPNERCTASAVAAIDHLPRNEAVRMLLLECGGREKLCWDVYNYWAGKRKKWGKPILRRLQAPTLASDTNPYNTFRTREKTNRPQTRRRRDNSDELLDKLRQLRDNLVGAKAVLEEVVRRERRKRDLSCTEVELLRIRYRTHHEVGAAHEAISSEALNALRERMRLNGQADQIRGGMRVLANKATLPAGVPLSKKIRSETVMKCLRPMVATMIAPPPPVEPEALWSLPANLLQIPLESKEAARNRMDDIRRGRPSGFAQPGAAGAAADEKAAAAGSGGGAEKQKQGEQQPPAAAAAAAGSGLPPAGPAAPGGRMNAVVASLNERSHLFKLPDGLCSDLGAWRCFVGRGGRARLERIDHVTHETVTNMKMEQQKIQNHYQNTPWPPMPTAPLLREIVEKSRPPPPTRQSMHRSGSMGLASQGSAGGSAMHPQAAAAAAAAAAQRRASSANLGLMQQQQAGAGGAAGAAAAAPAGNGMASAASLQPMGSAQAVAAGQPPQQMQAQQAHTMQQPHQQQQVQPMAVDPQQQQQQMAGQGGAAAAGMAAGQQQMQPMQMQQQQQQQPGMPVQQQQQMQDPAAMAAAQQQQQQQQAAYMAAMQQQQMQQQQAPMAAG